MSDQKRTQGLRVPEGHDCERDADWCSRCADWYQDNHGTWYRAMSSEEWQAFKDRMDRKRGKAR